MEEEYRSRTDTLAPADGVTHQKMVQSCATCTYLQVYLQPGHPPTAEDLVSWLLAHENVAEVSCAVGRIRYNSGNEKRYKTKYPLTIVPDEEVECPGYVGPNDA